jgi:hypothetical protein
LTAGDAIETAGPADGVVTVTVFPTLMPPTTGWVKVVFIGALPDPAKGTSTVTGVGPLLK